MFTIIFAVTIDDSPALSIRTCPTLRDVLDLAHARVDMTEAEQAALERFTSGRLVLHDVDSGEAVAVVLG